MLKLSNQESMEIAENVRNIMKCVVIEVHQEAEEFRKAMILKEYFENKPVKH